MNGIQRGLISCIVLTVLSLITVAFADLTAFVSLPDGKLLPTSETKINIKLPTNETFAKIDHISILDTATNTLIDSKIATAVSKGILTITVNPYTNLALGNGPTTATYVPYTNLLQNHKYELKIFTPTKQYKMILKTDKYVNFKDYKTTDVYECVGKKPDGYNLNQHVFYKRIEIPANPEKGFFYPYFLNVPMATTLVKGQTVSTEKYPATSYSKYLFVEPNNTGAVNSEYFAEQVLEANYYGSTGRTPSSALGMTFLMPAFPRPSNNTYTHMLDEETLFMTKEESDALGVGNLVGIDKQLIAMIADAKEQLKANGVILQEKIVLDGFSAGSDFAQRFSMIYPEMIEVCISGTSNPFLPVKSYKNTTLNFPLGINDFKEKFGRAFNLNAYLAIKQYWFIGENDHGNILNYNDGFNEQDKNTIINTFSSDGIDRWAINQTIFASLNANIQFHTYKNIGHENNNVTNIDSIKFLKANLGQPKLVPIVPAVSGVWR